jgi:hypothetical protein
MGKYIVLKTTRSPARVPYSDKWRDTNGHYRTIECQDHVGCVGQRWSDGWDITHEMHVIPTNGAVAVPEHSIPPSVYSSHKGEGGSLHNVAWCRRYCGGRPPSELNERASWERK